jgi:2-oxoglutarate ferredoxin oxidoreductase subunit alpha
LKKEYGIELDYMRLRAYPFSRAAHDFIAGHDLVYVVEQNRDAQMLELLKLDAAPDQIVKLRSVLHYNGLPIDARSVTDEIVAQEGR